MLATATTAAMAALSLVACSVVAGGGRGGGNRIVQAASPPASQAYRSAGARASAPTVTPGQLSPPVVPGLSWRAEGTVVHGRPATYVAAADGGAIGLLWIDPQLVSFRLVPGYKVPEAGPVLPMDNRPQTWVPHMVAAFNGGFLLQDHVGGYVYAHRTVRALTAGLGAFEITSDGQPVGRHVGP